MLKTPTDIKEEVKRAVSEVRGESMGKPSNNDSKERARVLFNEEIDFQQELRINKYKLDEECLSQASRYAFYAEAYALAKSDVAQAKDNLSYVLAVRSMAIRNLYNESHEKYTEGRLQAAVEIDDEVVVAKSNLRKAEDIANKMLVAVNAMDVRKSELENLVKLYCAGYFSNVSTNVNKKDINENTSMDIRRNLNKGECDG